MRVVSIQTLVNISKSMEVNIVVRDKGANTVSTREAVSGIQLNLLVL